ncbi:hypothetical protein LTR56_004356 [Elasticomyces elasticus]|nr:hypothetical protein LTR22_012084 [Elasticomyces elasticus]KAK3653944.1 hypothetical protein LTR56_004356 [Elasticomyces elasticus]KAK4917168.1 hypothetical protein LTR49_014933 [Elasticomyces elasticus]KAK5757102.1 hypothetical protein LTS12_012776 [Elasticomyces elasticus]
MSSAPFPIWGEGGILQWREDHTVMMFLDDEANLWDLMARLHTPLLQEVPKALVNRYSLYREYCFGEESTDIVRKYLDSGVLKLLADKYLEMLKKDEQHPKGFRVGHVLILLATGALSHGATLPVELENALPKLLKNPTAHAHPFARKQVQKALQEYIQGTKYDFGNETMDETTIKSTLGLRKAKFKTTFDRVFRHITIVSFEGETPNQKLYNEVGSIIATAGPPENINMAFSAPQGHVIVGRNTTWQYNVCGGCGKQESTAAMLSACGGCKARKYCSRACQKKNFKYHKVVCSRSEEVMAELKRCLKEGQPVFMPEPGTCPRPP